MEQSIQLLIHTKRWFCVLYYTYPDPIKRLLLPFHRHRRLQSPYKIVQSKLVCRLKKAASELGLHYFLEYLAHGLRFTNKIDLLLLFAF